MALRAPPSGWHADTRPDARRGRRSVGRRTGPRTATPQRACLTRTKALTSSGAPFIGALPSASNWPMVAGLLSASATAALICLMIADGVPAGATMAFQSLTSRPL